MLDNQDIQNLVDKFSEIFPTKDEIISKGDFEDLHKDFRDLQASVDAYAVKADKYFQEHTMLSGKVDRHEGWIKKLAEKTETKLGY